jgi:hypothetical protein
MSDITRCGICESPSTSAKQPSTSGQIGQVGGEQDTTGNSIAFVDDIDSVAIDNDSTDIDSDGSIEEKRRRKSGGKKRNYVQKYKPIWEKSQTWLNSVAADETKARCKVCMLDIRAKMSCIKEHEASAFHTAVCAPSKNSSRALETAVNVLALKSLKIACIIYTLFFCMEALAFSAADRLSVYIYVI